jgi:protein-disulfide isomerase
VINSDFYQGAAVLFEKTQNNKYYLEATKVGVPIGEYLESPDGENGISLNNDSQAQNTLVAYTDLTCKNCQKTYGIIKDISDRDENDVKVIIKLTPNEEENKYAKKVAIGAKCASEQNKFNEYVTVVFDNKKEISNTNDINSLLIEYAKKIDLDTDKFQDCLESKKTREFIEQSTAEAKQFGITQVPQIFTNGQPSAGSMTYDNLMEQLEVESR